LLSILIISIFLLTSFAANIDVFGGSNSVQWSSPTGGQHHTLRSPFKAKNTMGGLEWEVGLGARKVTPPVIGVDGLTYVSTENWGSDPTSLHCLDRSGNIVWSKIFDADKICGPVIEEDGNLIFAYEERDVGNFIARYSPYGEQLLVRSIEGSPFLGPVLDDEGHIYLIIKKTSTEYRGGYWGRYESTIENYNLTKFTTGMIDLWEFELSNYQNSPTLPTITPGGFIAVNGDDFYFLSPDGIEIWSVGDIWTDHPALYFEDKLYIASSSIMCYDLEGNRDWSNRPDRGSIDSTIALTSDNGLVFFDDDYYVYKVDLDGMMLWEKDIQTTGFSSPFCSSDGYIFGCSNSEVIKFDSRGNRLLTTDYLDIPEGDWEVDGSLALSSDGSIYFSGESGIAKFRGIDISAHVTFAWVSLIFMTIGMTIGAIILYNKISLPVIRKKSISVPSRQTTPGASIVQCPRCSVMFDPGVDRFITCPSCGEMGQRDIT